MFMMRLPVLVNGFQHPGCLVQKPFCSLRISVEDHVLYASEQLRFDVVIYLQHRRIQDGHVQSCLDGVIQECRMHRLSHSIVPAEGK